MFSIAFKYIYISPPSLALKYNIYDSKADKKRPLVGLVLFCFVFHLKYTKICKSYNLWNNENSVLHTQK